MDPEPRTARRSARRHSGGMPAGGNGLGRGARAAPGGGGLPKSAGAQQGWRGAGRVAGPHVLRGPPTLLWRYVPAPAPLTPRSGPGAQPGCPRDPPGASDSSERGWGSFLGNRPRLGHVPTGPLSFTQAQGWVASSRERDQQSAPCWRALSTCAFERPSSQRQEVAAAAPTPKGN